MHKSVPSKWVTFNVIFINSLKIITKSILSKYMPILWKIKRGVKNILSMSTNNLNNNLIVAD